MEAIAINDNTWYFSGAVGRAFLFRGSQAALLVDTTNGPGNLREIITKLVGDIPVILVNTHADSDHIGCNHQFEKTLMHPSEFAYYACKCKPGDAIPNPIFDGEIIDIDVEGFFNVVEDCVGRVQLITEEGDVLNLKSKLSRLVAISSIFSNSEIGDLELVCAEKEDIERLMNFMMNGNSMSGNK